MLSQGVSGLSKRDIQLFVEAGYNTVESVAYTYAVGTNTTSDKTILTSCSPKKILETIKGVSEQKATKILVEGKFRDYLFQAPANFDSV